MPLPMDTESLMADISALARAKRPGLEDLSLGEKIAAAFGEIGITMQRMAGRNAPSALGTMLGQKREEFEATQGDVMKQLALKIQVAQMRGTQEKARQKLLGEALPKAMEVFGKLKEQNADPKAWRAATASLNQTYPGMIPPDLAEGILSGDAGMESLYQAYAADLLKDPALVENYLRVWRANRKTPKVAENWLRTTVQSAIGEQINRAEEANRQAGKDVPREDVIRQVIEGNPKYAPFAKDFPGYTPKKGTSESSSVEVRVFNSLLREFGGDEKKARTEYAKWQQSTSKEWTNQAWLNAHAAYPDDPQKALQAFANAIGVPAFTQSQQRTLGATTGPAAVAATELAGKKAEEAAAGTIQGKLRPVPAPSVGGQPLSTTNIPGVGAVASATAAGQPVPPGERRALSEFALITQLSEEVVRDSRNFTAQFFGPVTGRVGAIREQITGNMSDEEVNVRRNLADIKDSLLRARSGAQINEAEYARLSKLVPDIVEPANIAKAKMKSFRSAIASVAAERKRLQSAPASSLDAPAARDLSIDPRWKNVPEGKTVKWIDGKTYRKVRGSPVEVP